MEPQLVLESVVTCPQCGFEVVEAMPTDACLISTNAPLPRLASPEGWRLLRLLFLRFRQMSACATGLRLLRQMPERSKCHDGIMVVALISGRLTTRSSGP